MSHINVLLRDIKFSITNDGPWAGVDAGVKGLLKANLAIEKAYGDFDSVTPEDLKLFKKSVDLDIVPSVKNFTDSELAMLSLAELGYTSIDVYGALGGRKDHELTNIQLLSHDKLRNINIRLLNDTNEITLLTAGLHILPAVKDKKYVSFIPLYDGTRISLKGFKYNLEDTYVSIGKTLTVSNEYDKNTVSIQADKDILMINSKD